LIRLSRLSSAELCLFAEALGWVMLVRLALWCLPFRTTWAACRRLARHWRRQPHSPPAERIDEAVNRAGRVVPDATCLTRALALSVMLGRAGYSCEVRLGAARAGDRFLAHAWVECDGRPATALAYSPFPSLGDFSP
jgi:hypothetical protein